MPKTTIARKTTRLLAAFPVRYQYILLTFVYSDHKPFAILNLVAATAVLNVDDLLAAGEYWDPVMALSLN